MKVFQLIFSNFLLERSKTSIIIILFLKDWLLDIVSCLWKFFIQILFHFTNQITQAQWIFKQIYLILEYTFSYILDSFLNRNNMDIFCAFRKSGLSGFIILLIFFLWDWFIYRLVRFRLAHLNGITSPF